MMNNSVAHAHTKKVQRKYKNDLSKGRENDLQEAEKVICRWRMNRRNR